MESSVSSNPFDEFPEQVRQDVEGLLWLGYLEDSFDFGGHNFVIRTLRGEEELLAALATKKYVETLGQSRAWAWANVSLCLIAVDGDEEFCPSLGPNREQYAQARFQYVTQRWFWPTCAEIFNRFTDLNARQANALQRVEDLSKGNLPLFMPFADSSTDKGDSQSTPVQEAPDMQEGLDLLQEDSTPSSDDS